MTAAAARLDDPIEHSSALGGLLAGLAIGAGAVLIGIAVIGTGGLGAVALAAMVGAGAATGAGIGQLIGSLSFACSETGQIRSGSSNVYINGKPAARAHLDNAECSDHPGGPKILAQGSDSVYINGQPAARVGDRTVCDAKISAGSPNVCIGGGTATTDAIDPEIPVWLERAVMALGLASAFVLASPVLVVAGVAGGIAGGMAGHWAGGELFGEGSDGQKLMAFGGALLGGGLGAKGGKAFDARYEIRSHGFGSNLGNVKVVRRAAPPLTPKKGISPQLYQKLRAKTPSREIQAMVNKDVVLPMKDPALPGLEVTKPLHADHIVPMKTITEMKGFDKLTFEQQVEILNYKPNFHGLSETANTSRGAKTYSEWTQYKKGGVDVDPGFRSSMMERAMKLEVELQEMISGVL
ncbi:TPA: PAAR domain-containing protein [Pseudomonas putida]|uniref:PAAR domain-containing protein n=1 Tax=Pseudomonas putida TaxID=303 RepID=UPI00110C9359|nr:PAAR domain-containing protein [Pseudomonas putida]MDD1991237.1 PAAR domain-containing protein [Pseudomonas putida]HDS0917277.1 PAAR domain-containing protein [Pseudomonas putida]HDS0931972.1 PAAR domain-containing protein [Pseudomonas putida]HDS1781275.1 PAAR domain-containing protein [Pseudomonas putida]HDS3798309.1 PAAR domain-containing protein [Pseudomonas putida]